MRTAKVFGDANVPLSQARGPSMRTADIAVSPANKFILGDWIWHFNRGLTDRRAVWHNYKGKSLVVMLFGDGHSEGYKFPNKPQSDPFWAARPSPTNAWW